MYSAEELAAIRARTARGLAVLIGAVIVAAALWIAFVWLAVVSA
jgi:hypothetical protein